MLQCPLCATRYADGTTACPLDHSELLPVPTPGEYGPLWAPDSRAFALAVSSRGSATFPPVICRPGEASAAPDPLLGQVLGAKLRVLRRIGQGGMGTVYIAEHVGLGKPVAIKVLSTPYGQSGQPVSPGLMADLVHRLHTEARHTAAIKNEHIVEIFDIGTTPDGRPYVEMELLTGESLAQRLARCSALSEADTLRLGRQLASALAAAHHSGIVHRDIKPENIFLCAPAAYGKDPGDGDFVKVLDFGISKAVRALRPDDLPGGGSGSDATQETRLTRTGAILGTPLYMSPEQVRGERLDHRVDVYAVGVVLYECLTGSVPHGACNYLAVVAKILTEPPEPPSQRSPERAISPELEHIVLRAMATERAERYPTMESLHEDLRRYGAGEELLPRLAARLTGAAPTGAPGAAGAAGSSDNGGPLGHLWRPILIGMILVLGLGGAVAAVLRPRGPWGAGALPPPRPDVRVDVRADGRAAPPRPAAALPVRLLARGGSLAAVPSQDSSLSPGARPQGTTPSASGRTTPAPPLIPGGELHPAHRQPRPPRPDLPPVPPRQSLGDALLLDEQAPNPFLPAPSSGRPAMPARSTAPADDTSPDPR